MTTHTHKAGCIIWATKAGVKHMRHSGSHAVCSCHISVWRKRIWGADKGKRRTCEEKLRERSIHVYAYNNWPRRWLPLSCKR